MTNPIFSSKASFIIKSALGLFIAGLIKLLFKFSASILVAQILGPAKFGLWSIVELINRYSPIATLGVPSGVKREIPYLNAKKHPDKANKIANTGLIWMIIYSFILSLGGIIYFLISNNEILIRFAIASTLIGAGLFQLYQYLNILLLVQKNFFKSSIYYVLEGFVSFILAISLVYGFNIYGQLLVLPFVSIVMIIFYFVFYQPDLKFQWDPNILLKSIKIGILIITVGTGYMILLSINRIILEKYLGLEAVGHFSFAMLIIVLFSQLTGSLGEVIYTYMNEHLGKYERVDNMNNLAFYPAIGKILIIPILTGVAIIIIPYFIDKFIPQYIESINICQTILIAITLTSGSIDILGSYLKQKLLLLFLAISIILNVYLSLFTLSKGLGVNGIGLALLCSLFCYHFFVTLSSLYFMNVSRWSIIKFLTLFFGYPILILALISPLALHYGSYILQLNLFIAIFFIPIIFIFIAWKKPSIILFN